MASQGVDCLSAVHVVSRSPVKPWTKQISIVVSRQLCNTLIPSGKEGASGRLLEGDPECSVSMCGRGPVVSPLVLCSRSLRDGLSGVFGCLLKIRGQIPLRLFIVRGTLDSSKKHWGKGQIIAVMPVSLMIGWPGLRPLLRKHASQGQETSIHSAR